MIVSMVALLGIAGLALGAVSIDRGRAVGAFSGKEARLPLSQRMARLDNAIARRDVSRATSEWRDTFSLALGARRWEAMADMGDAAVRIDALAAGRDGRPTGFRAEARQAYLRALFQARSQQAPEGIERVAQAFASLGDVEMATRSRALAETVR
jgi:hypothetical protein